MVHFVAALCVSVVDRAAGHATPHCRRAAVVGVSPVVGVKSVIVKSP